ncbi:hypothetical protein NUM3379_16510 [Kineococcus sp. NUM-3379]
MSLTSVEDFERAAQFPVARRGGYSEAEVDGFVDRVRTTILDLVQRLRASEDARAELEARLAAGGSAPAPAQEPASPRALRLLELAEQSANAAIEDAQRTAEQMVAEAGERAAAREEEAREAALAIEAAGRQREVELQDSINTLLESEHAARLQVHELARQLTALLENPRGGDVPAQQMSPARP